MKREDDPELWDLLEKAGEPTLSPFFSRNVLREIRQESSWRDSLLLWLRPKRLIPAAAGVALALFVTMISGHLSKPDVASQDDPPDAVVRIDPQDYEVVADLDNLLASEDDNVWSENESLSL